MFFMGLRCGFPAAALRFRFANAHTFALRARYGSKAAAFRIARPFRDSPTLSFYLKFLEERITAITST